MLTIYPAIFYELKDGRYSVLFPDLNDLATCGEDFNDAMAMAIDCLAGYVFTEGLEGNALPAATALSAFDPHCRDEDIEPEDGVVGVSGIPVSVDVEEYARTHFSRKVKKTITIPEWLDTMATGQHINFSQTMQEALKAKLGLAV